MSCGGTSRSLVLMTDLSHSQRLRALRTVLAEQDFDGFIIPHADAHQNEFLPPNAERLAWLTGFAGSAGSAAVLAEPAAIFVDGRYTLQVRDQVDGADYAYRHSVTAPMDDWLRENLLPKARLAFDPWLHTQTQRERLERAVKDVGAALVPVMDNPVDAVWENRPGEPLTPIVPHPEQFSGLRSAAKRADLAASLGANALDAVVLTQPDSIAWLLNVRGNDVDHTPLPLSFAIAHADGRFDWFVAPEKLSDALAQHLGSEISIHGPDALGGELGGLAQKRVWVCPNSAAAWIFDRLMAGEATIARGPDPVTLSKAIKNEIELAGTRAAHLRDGVALVGFLHWLSEAAPGGGVDELGAAAKLAAFRAPGEHFRDLSFGTISGSGPNGAIVHYRVTEESNRVLGASELYLVDSGAQYLDGTTDVTRTVAIGAPSAEMQDRFTRVLKGHIGLATLRFPEGTTGTQIDALARQSLWQAGLDYDHGTGHGVGSYLGVHEGPQRISKVGAGTALQPGMIVSNEPGYYKEGVFGIRIENLVAVSPATDIAGGERAMLGFETLTLAPIDRGLIVTSLLNPDERDWLDAYHARVREEVGGLLTGAAHDWLVAATAPLEND